MFCKTNQLFFVSTLQEEADFPRASRVLATDVRCGVFVTFFVVSSLLHAGFPGQVFFGEERARDREIFCSPDSWVDMGTNGVEFSGGGRLLRKIGLPKDGLIFHYLSPADIAFGRGHIRH